MRKLIGLAVLLLALVGCDEAVKTAADFPDEEEVPPNEETPLGDPIIPNQPIGVPGGEPVGTPPLDLPDPAVRTHCVDVENLKAPYLISFDWRRWEWDFVNNCGESVHVAWKTRHPKIEWSGWSWSLDVGERSMENGQWAQNSNPPNPITVWCAWVGTSSDPCYRENDYLTNPTNWREMHY